MANVKVHFLPIGVAEVSWNNMIAGLLDARCAPRQSTRNGSRLPILPTGEIYCIEAELTRQRSMSHHVTPETAQCFADKATLILETARHMVRPPQDTCLTFLR